MGALCVRWERCLGGARLTPMPAEWQRWGFPHGADAWQLMGYLQLAPGPPPQLKRTPDL